MENKQKIIKDLKSLRNQLDFIIDLLKEDIDCKKYLRNVTLDLRDVYKSNYLKSKADKT